jgi:fucose permease
MNGSTSLVLTALSGTFFAGVLLALLRNLKGPLAEHLSTTEGRIGRLRAAFTVLLVPMMLVSGWLLDKWGLQWGLQTVLVGGSLLAGLGISLLDSSRNDRSALPCVLLTAGGTAALTVGSLVLLPQAFYPRNPIAAMNLGCVSLALGILLTQGFMGWLTRQMGFRRALLLLALGCLFPAACGMLLTTADLETPPVARHYAGTLGPTGLWVAAGILLLYQPVEEALGRMTRTFLKEVHAPERTVTFWLGLVWLGFLGTRLLAGLVVRPGYESWLVLFAIMFAGVCLGNLIGTYRAVAGGLTLLLLGVSLAPVFPTVLGLVLRSFPAEAGSACGLLMAAATTGVLLPSLLHPASERHGPRTAMRLALGFALVLVGPALVLVLVQ